MNLKDLKIKKNCNNCDHQHHHAHGQIWEELMCHIPYAGMSLGLSFAFLSVLYFFGLNFADKQVLHQGYHILFHAFHYLHIIVAVAGAAAMFFRFSQNILLGIFVALIAPTFFCILSDIMLPAVAGNLLGVPMTVHICFTHLNDAINLMAFMAIGLVCGLALLHHKGSLQAVSLTSHFMHILVSSLASLFYTVAHGFDTWYNSMGILFVFLFIAVIIPCTLSDVVVPLYFARSGHKH